jgi:hypothetical protein
MVLLGAGWVMSCTFDYFVDEMNYQVFVPGVQLGTVEDCRVLVYDEAGRLVKTRYAERPFDGDPRVVTGNFSFKLAPGRYTVFCYTDAGGMPLAGIDQLETACLESWRVEDAAGKILFDDCTEDAYAEPLEVFSRKLSPEIGRAKGTRVDTAEMEMYAGRITMRFKNFPGNASRVAFAQVVTRGVGTRQELSLDTLPSRFSEDDYLFIEKTAVQRADNRTLEVDFRAFPSLEGSLITSHVKFLDDDGSVISTIPVEMRDLHTNLPLRLLHGRRVILEVESYTVVRVDIVGWDEDISNSDREI